jgi:hypothetical protein
MGDPLDPDVRAFVLSCSSAAQLEVLLLLRQVGGDWTADQVAEQLRIDPAAAAAELDELRERDLLVAAPAYRYAPRDPAVAAVVDRVAVAYAERRVTVISVIYSQPASAARRFSAAFLLRRKDDDDG